MARDQHTCAGDAAAPTSVYRYYDANGVLLYVGITSRGISRNSEHNTSKAWWPYVVRQDVDHYETRSKALAAERAAIRRFRTSYNVQHNPGHAAVRAAYEAFAATPVVDSSRNQQTVPLDVLSIGHRALTLATRLAHRSVTQRIATEQKYPAIAATPEHSGVGVVRTITESSGIVLLDLTGRKLPASISEATATLKVISGAGLALRVSRVNLNFPRDEARV